MVVSSEGQGMIESISDMIEAAAGGVTAAEAEARRIAQELLPHWRHYRQLHISGDLSRMVREIVCGAGIQRPTRRRDERASAQGKPGLGGVTVRGGGGLYFVLAAQGEALERLRALIESFPTDGRHEPYFVMQPVLDEQHAKGHLARAAHAGFVDEIAALRADLERMAASKSPTEESVAARLAAYKETVAKLDTYAELLGMQRETITGGISELRQQALQLLMREEEEEEEEEEEL